MSIIDAIIREVAELPDRTSPDDQPDMMLVRESELRDILMQHFADAAAFLDELARDIDRSWQNDWCMMKDDAADCRAMAAKLRGEI